MKVREFNECFNNSKFILTEGAIVERVKREFNISIDSYIGIAGLIYNKNSRKVLEKIYKEYINIAEKYNLPIMLMTNTRKCNMENVNKSPFKKYELIKDYAEFLHSIGDKSTAEVFIGGLIGCYGDAYSSNESIGYKKSVEFHKWHVEKLVEANLDFTFGGILPALDEATGIAKLMANTLYPYIISFMVNENGTLLDGTSVNEAILSIDNIVSRKPVCYMSNCIHPKILEKALSCECNLTDTVRRRFLGLQANASELHPSLLNNSTKLYTSSDGELYSCISELHNKFPMKIYGGCCGTDASHLNLIGKGMVNELV
jgi:S-methylmethionine-dependent homocysteine/selenocysteine methylase